MSAMSPVPGGYAPETGWPLPSHMLGGAREPLRQALLLERCFEGEAARWSDALIARTRRHIGGCVAAVETSLRTELEQRAPGLPPLAEIVPASIGWTAFQRWPSLLGPDLVRHFRDRAGISLMAQNDQMAWGAVGAGPGAPPEYPSFLPSIAVETLSKLTFAQARWADAGPDETSMRPDVSAEAMERLVWVLTALLADRLARTGLMPVPDMLALADQAGRAVLSAHDEQTGPFALAALLAHQVRGQEEGMELLLWLARNHHMAALIAMMADRIDMDGAILVSTIMEAPEQLLFDLCRAADFPREVAVRLVLGRRCMSRGVEDSVLIHYADAYEHGGREDAARAIVPLRLSNAFREGLAALRDRGPVDER
ncbi:MAG: DUF2336 domain-containing protein [Sphingobium sp.]